MPWLQDPKLAILKAAPACCAGMLMPRPMQRTITDAYYNSGGRLSLYAGREVAIGEGFLEIGLASGYGEKATPMLRYRKGNVFIVPAYQEAKKESVYGVVLGWQF